MQLIRWNTGLTLATWVALGLSGMTAGAAQEYTIIDIGVLPSGYWSRAYGLSEDGKVVGWSTVIQGEVARIHAVLWEDGTLYDAGTLPGFPDSYALGVNSSGQLVGTSHNAAYTYRAFFWDFWTITDLGSIGTGSNIANAINEAGVVVGHSFPLGFVWTPDTGMIDIGSLSAPATEPFDINELGQVVGVSNSYGHFRGFVLTPDDGVYFRDDNGDGVNDLMVEIGVIPPGVGSWAYGINNLGQVAGRARVSAELFPIHAIFWDDGVMTDLGTLGGQYSVAWSINDTGLVVGNADLSTDVERPFVWDAVHGMRDLNGLLPPMSAWTLAQAWEINNAGQIVGYGMHYGQPRGFLMTPVARGDCDGNGAIDLTDFQSLSACLTGPGETIGPDCPCVDFDDDDDVDLADFGAFQRAIADGL